MNYEQQEQLKKRFELYSDDDYKPKIKFKNLENKLSECKQLGAIIFLHSKLKPENKEEEYFLHGEHEELYIGSSFDIFENFTEEDVKTAIAYGISLANDRSGGFLIYASM